MKSIRTVALLATLVLMPAAAHAQTAQNTILTACYVPKSGSVYRIKAEGTPTKCGTNHVEFSWFESSVPVFSTKTYTKSLTIGAGGTLDWIVSCLDPQERILTGGYGTDGWEPAFDISANRPVMGDALQGWRVTFTNQRANDHTITLSPVCCQLSPAVVPGPRT